MEAGKTYTLASPCGPQDRRPQIWKAVCVNPHNAENFLCLCWVYSRSAWTKKTSAVNPAIMIECPSPEAR